MSRKIKLLFVNESLALAGGEKSLIALLSNLDPNNYEIDLQLFRYGGSLEKFIPKYVNVLPPIPYTSFASNNIINNLKSIFKKDQVKFLKSKISYSIKLRGSRYTNPEKAQLYWESSQNSIPVASKEYDVAIAYAQGIPTFYVIDKIKGKRKITWMNAKPNFSKRNFLFQKFYYERYDVIVPVSNVTNKQLEEIFPKFVHKFEIITDIVDYKSIRQMADLNKVGFEKNVFNILTVARLNLKSKRYDLTLEACKILKDKGLNFHWYALGEGPYRHEIQKFIKNNNLQNHFTLLGTTVNPYPYFNEADLYVQTSEFESFGISIAEARLLNIPVITTRFDTVHLQMIHERNGLICDLDADAIAKAICRIMGDRVLYNSIVDYLKHEVKEDGASVKKFDDMVSELLIMN